MIRTFACHGKERLFHRERVRRFVNIESVARRKQEQLHAAASLDFLRVPPGNRLERLKGNRLGQHSVRVNDQHRICFDWPDGGAQQVEIVDQQS